MVRRNNAMPVARAVRSSNMSRRFPHSKQDGVVVEECKEWLSNRRRAAGCSGSKISQEVAGSHLVTWL